MSFQAETEKPERPSFLKRALAFLILIAAVLILIKILWHTVVFVFWIGVGIAAIVGIFWAYHTIKK